MKQAFLQLHLAVLLASCSGIFGNLISLDPVFHKVWQDYRW